MGDPVPSTWPDLDPAKFYQVHADIYDDGIPVGNCTKPFAGRTFCCPTGNVINGWYAAGGDCTPDHEICLGSGFSAQRIVSIIGPFDLFGDCMAF